MIRQYRTEHDISGAHEHDVKVIGTREVDGSNQRVSVVKPAAQMMQGHDEDKSLPGT
jgi:transcription elongation GreA/GreB family factor